jgi:tetratricopeptide (TPR) repeat protein
MPDQLTQDLVDAEKALTLLRQAWAMAPQDPELPAALCRCLRRLDRHQEARWLLQQQLQLNPEALPLMLAEVEELLEAGELQAALRHLLALLPRDGDGAGVRPLLERLASVLLPEGHPAWKGTTAELLQSLVPGLPTHVLLLQGMQPEAVAAVATQLEAPGWQQLGPVPGPWLQAQPLPADEAALQALAVAVGSRCAAAAVVVVDCALAGQRALWQGLARQRGLNLAMLLVISHPLQILQRQRRQGMETQQALLQWLQWHQDAEATMGADPWRPFDVRRLPVSTIQALPWVVGRPPEPALLLQVLDRHDALLNPAKPAAVRETGSVEDAVQVLSDRAVAAQTLGDALLAEWLLRLALELMPQHRGLYAALARCLRDQQRLPEAEALLNHHLADDPQSAPGWIGLAEVARELGRWQMAIDHYARALALDPGHGGLPRALRHTAARMLPPSDPRLEGTAQELLTCLRPGLPRCWLIVLDLYGKATSPHRYLRAAYGELLQGLKHPPDDPSRLTLAVTPERLERLLTALQADVNPSADRAAISLLIDERQVSLQPLWNLLLAQRGLDAGVVLVNRPPLEVVHRLILLEGLTVRQALFYWIHHQLEAEAESRHLPRVRVDFRRMQTELGMVIHDCEALLPGPGSLTEEQRAELQLLVEADQVGPAEVSTEDMPLLTLALGLFGALCDQDEERCREGVDHAAAAFRRFQSKENRPPGPTWRSPQAETCHPSVATASLTAVSNDPISVGSDSPEADAEGGRAKSRRGAFSHWTNGSGCIGAEG